MGNLFPDDTCKNDSKFDENGIAAPTIATFEINALLVCFIFQSLRYRFLWDSSSKNSILP